jgi:hypothetical protein
MMRLDAAKSVTVHCLQAWRVLVSIGVGALSRARRDGDDNNGDDDNDWDGWGMACAEDIKRGCGALAALAAVVEAGGNIPSRRDTTINP